MECEIEQRRAPSLAVAGARHVTCIRRIGATQRSRPGTRLGARRGGTADRRGGRGAEPDPRGARHGPGGKPFIASTTFDLAQVGYEQAEYFISGTASAFTSAAPLTSDGRWMVTPGETAGYKTRVSLRRAGGLVGRDRGRYPL